MTDESEITFTVDCLPVRQPIGEFYIASIPAQQLRDITEFDIRRVLRDRRDIEQYLGIQRPLVRSRVNEIHKYVRTTDACFPTAVIIAIPAQCVELSDDSKSMTIKNDPTPERSEDRVLYRNIARVLDGQHRLAGLEGFDGEFEINVAVFVDADISDQAIIFSTVNLAQTKVNKSLVYDLFDVMQHRSPQKVAHNIAVLLDRESSSPFYRMIKRLGVATEGRYANVETLTQATVVQPIINLISNDPMVDRDAYLKGAAPKKLEGSELTRHPLQHLFVDDKDFAITDVIWNYFSSVHDRWPTAWATRDRGFMLNRTNGYRALMRFLQYLYRTEFTPNSVPDKAAFDRIFDEISLDDSDFNTERFHPGTGGESALFAELIERHQ